MTHSLLLLAALVPLGALTAHAQNQLNGRVLDSRTHQPVPYASVVVSGTPLGTTANAEGEFVLPVRQLPTKILAFSLGYGRDSATVAQSGAALTLSLAPAPIELTAVEPAGYAAELLMRAYQQMQRTRPQAGYGQAFYRQITRNGDQPTEVLEAVWDVKASSAGVEGTRLAQGRYAARSAFVNFSNLSIYTKGIGRVSGIAAPDTADSHAVVSAYPTRYYVLHYKGVTQNGPYQLAEVAYESRPGAPAVQGSVFIDLASYHVLHARAIRPANVSASNPKMSLREATITAEADFKPASTGTLPNYVRVSMTLMVAMKNKPDLPVRAESLTSFYDLRPVPTGLPYAGPEAVADDLAAIKHKAYDPTYWRDNPVVKRTPLEDQIMHSFEDNKAFGTLLKQ